MSKVRSPERIKRYMDALTRLANLVRQTRTPTGRQAFAREAPQLMQLLSEIPREYNTEDALNLLRRHYNELERGESLSLFGNYMPDIRARVVARLNALGKVLQAWLHSPNRFSTAGRHNRLLERSEQLRGRAFLEPSDPYIQGLQHVQFMRHAETVAEQQRADEKFRRWALQYLALARELDKYRATFRRLIFPGTGVGEDYYITDPATGRKVPNPKKPTRLGLPDLRTTQQLQSRLRQLADKVGQHMDNLSSFGRASPLFWATGGYRNLIPLIEELNEAISTANQERFNRAVSGMIAHAKRILNFKGL